MARSDTHYDALGVRRSATPKQIKDAYIQLIKRHHPDRLLQAGRGDSNVDVRRVNLAYSILKDSFKRQQYDLELDRRMRPGPILASAGRPSPRRRFPLAPAAAVLAGIILAEIVVTATSRSAGGRGIGASAAAFVSSAQSLGRSARLDATYVPSAPEFERATAEAMDSTPGRAISSSSLCFARAREESRPDSSDACVVFDLAYLYSHQTGQMDQAPLYFQEQNVERRALDALAGFGSAGSAERVDALRAATFNILLEQVNAQSDAEERRSRAIEAQAAAAAKAALANAE